MNCQQFIFAAGQNPFWTGYNIEDVLLKFSHFSMLFGDVQPTLFR